MPPAARLLMIVGAVLLALGLALWLVPGLRWLGHLPGDLRIERGNLRIFVPLTTSLLLSAALSLLVWLVSRMR